MHFSIVIPMHDEEDAFPALAAALEAGYARFAPAHDFEAVLVDDGSRDRTFDLAWTWAESARFPVKVVRLNPQEGIGGALRTGFTFATGEAVVTYDADLAYPFDDILRLVDALEAGADVVTASPYGTGGEVEDVGPLRLLLSRGANALYRLRFGARARHLSAFTCGFRIYRHGVLERITPRRNGFLATAELLVRAVAADLRVAEVASRLQTRRAGRSKMKVVRTALSHLAFLVRGV